MLASTRCCCFDNPRSLLRLAKSATMTVDCCCIAFVSNCLAKSAKPSSGCCKRLILSSHLAMLAMLSSDCCKRTNAPMWSAMLAKQLLDCRCNTKPTSRLAKSSARLEFGCCRNVNTTNCLAKALVRLSNGRSHTQYKSMNWPNRLVKTSLNCLDH